MSAGIEKIQKGISGLKDRVINGVGQWMDKSALNRAFILGVVVPTICVLGLVIMTKGGFLRHGFAALKNPSWTLMSGVGLLGAAAGASIAELINMAFNRMKDKQKRQASKIMAVMAPILYATALVVAPILVYQHGAPLGGFLTTTHGLIYGAACGGFFYITARSIKRFKQEGTQHQVNTRADRARRRAANRASLSRADSQSEGTPSLLSTSSPVPLESRGPSASQSDSH